LFGFRVTGQLIRFQMITITRQFYPEKPWRKPSDCVEDGWIARIVLPFRFGGKTFGEKNEKLKKIIGMQALELEVSNNL
jgi:hypothetical protein